MCRRPDLRRGIRKSACGVASLALVLGVCGSLSISPGQSADPAELVTRETQPTFKLQVQRNLVVVRAVVRDARGRAVPNLRKENFRVFDNGKPQSITQFATETAPSQPATGEGPASRPVDAEALPETASVPSKPQRYLGLYFDDVHMAFEEIVRTRDAADHYLAAALQASDRVGIFTSSGRTVLDFTDDRGKLHESLFLLRSSPVTASEINPCPEISDYHAYKMIHELDHFAIDIATHEALVCHFGNDERYIDQAQAEAESQAARVLNASEAESEYVLRGLDQLLRRVSALPGQRNMVLISPGFFTETERQRTGEVVERALRSQVIVSTLDARGLYVPLPTGDASKTTVILPDRVDLMGKKSMINLDRESRAADALRDIAYDTGGEYFHNSNDFEEGFRKVGALAEVYYILAFSPQNLKLDGRFHSLKVNVVAPPGLSVQARRGYFAPKTQLDASAQAQEEIEQAVFSQDEVKELAVELHTQFFKINESDAKLSILTHVDMHLLRFRKEEGRNMNNLTFVTALFDRDGKYMSGKEKLVQFRLRDGSLERIMQSGITTKTSFDVKPGMYLVRQVVRDAEGGQLSGLNRTVEIPF